MGPPYVMNVNLNRRLSNLVKRTTIISTRWDLVTIDDIDKLVKTPLNPTAPFANTSEAVRELAKVGVKVHNYQEMMKDPEKANEFLEQMQSMIKNDKVFEWANTLSNDQIDGFLMALQMQKDKRYEVKTLV